jgi:ribonuclease D
MPNAIFARPMNHRRTRRRGVHGSASYNRQPMLKPPPDVAPEIVKGDLTEQQLQAYLAGDAVAVDTETLGLVHIRDRLCLVQLCDRPGRAAIVQITRETLDPARPAASRSPRLKRLLEDPRVLKVFHFARFDVAALRHNLGIVVDPIYCTRTVSKLVRTYTDRHGLKDNLLELMDVEMDKAQRHTDWSNPDLTPEQVRYAISDVTLLLPLKDRLEEMLTREGRKELAEQCFKVIPVMAVLDLLGYEDLFEH